jgi:hypothetical protein
MLEEMNNTKPEEKTYKTWEEELASYPHPTARVFPQDYDDMPDGICSAGGWCWDWRGEAKMKGAVVQLLSPRAFELFPEAPKDGPWKGMLWFSRAELSNLCALEEREGLDFHGLAYVL